MPYGMDLATIRPTAVAQGANAWNQRFAPAGLPISMAATAIPITDFGYRRSDVTYDVVGVWGGAFFRLDDHIARFRRSMKALRLDPPETDETIRQILSECVRRTGLREAYVAMDCLRGRPKPDLPRHPINCRNYIAAFAIPWVWVMPTDMQERGAHLIIAKTPRIADASVDPKVKNFHWGDLTRGLFEAYDQGADNCVLLDRDGFVTEGPGYNVFAVTGGAVVTSDRGSLEGVTRLSVGELCAELGMPFAVRPIPAAELRDADEIFVATTAGGIMPASRIDGRILGNDRPGPISARLREMFWAKRAAGWHATPIEYNRG
jgi:branched-chain amino acid aminotransferase